MQVCIYLSVLIKQYPDDVSVEPKHVAVNSCTEILLQEEQHALCRRHYAVCVFILQRSMQKG